MSLKDLITELPFECKTSSLTSDNGLVAVPSGAGWVLRLIHHIYLNTRLLKSDNYYNDFITGR